MKRDPLKPANPQRGESVLVLQPPENPLDNRPTATKLSVSLRVSRDERVQPIGLDPDGLGLEMPMFGHSVNHVGIQLADLLASALLFPMASYRFCLNHVQNVHVDADFGLLTLRYGRRLSALQYRFRDESGRMRGGITVTIASGSSKGVCCLAVAWGKTRRLEGYRCRAPLR